MQKGFEPPTIRLDENGNGLLGETVIPAAVVSVENETTWANYNPTILCYGDSNTRYYQGDTSTTGPMQNSYGAWLDVLAMRSPMLSGSEVIISGNPGDDSSDAVSNYATEVTANDPDIVIYNYGTNDLGPVENPDLDSYITNMTTLITSAQSANILPIVLGIPWFSSNYGYGNDELIPVWNEALRVLCERYQVAFIDTDKMFRDNTAFYNETSTPKRHLSILGQKILGQKLYDVILEKINTAGLANEYKNVFGATGSDVRQIIKSSTFDVETNFVRYQLPGTDQPLDILTIPTGNSITFTVAGDFAVAFYPRANSTAVITSTGVSDSLSITNGTTDSLYWPIQRKRYKTNDTGSTSTAMTVTIAASGNSLYLRGVSAERLTKSSALTTVPNTRHFDIYAGTAKGGSTAPTETTIDTFRCLTFDADAEEAYFEVEVPNDWDGASDMTLSIWWTNEPGTAIADTETVKHDISYRSIAEGETTDNGTAVSTSATYTQSGAGTDKELMQTRIIIDYDNADQPLTAGDRIGFVYNRDMTTDTYGSDINVIRWQVEYTSNKIPQH